MLITLINTIETDHYLKSIIDEFCGVKIDTFC